MACSSLGCSEIYNVVNEDTVIHVYRDGAGRIIIFLQVVVATVWLMTIEDYIFTGMKALDLFFLSGTEILCLVNVLYGITTDVLS